MKLPSLTDLRHNVAELEQAMSDPVIAREADKLKQLAREHAQKQALLEVVQELEKLQREEAEVADLLVEADEGMRRLATEDATRLARELKATENKLEELLLERDPRDERDVILEIRAGAGGEEASLFAAELFRAYMRYAEERGWKTHVVNSAASEQGGYKEVVAEISGQSVFGVLKFERGVHRVQRVPETEKQGRTHTSTVTVAVLPQAEEVDVEIKPENLRIDTYRASGAGGQHVNKTSSAIRITHLPTGMVVAVQDERSQHKNREKAMKVLRSRLLEAREEEARRKAAADRKAQVGTGDRSEKIRTYNYPQDRITDHRIKQSWGNIPGVMEGRLSPILAALQEAEREALLKNHK